MMMTIPSNLNYCTSFYVVVVVVVFVILILPLFQHYQKILYDKILSTYACLDCHHAITFINALI